MESVVFTSIPSKQFAEETANCVLQFLKENKFFQQIPESEIDEIPIARAAKIYDLDPKTLYNLHNQGIITLKKLSGKTFVSKAEISKAMVSFKSKKQKTQ